MVKLQIQSPYLRPRFTGVEARPRLLPRVDHKRLYLPRSNVGVTPQGVLKAQGFPQALTPTHFQLKHSHKIVDI